MTAAGLVLGAATMSRAQAPAPAAAPAAQPAGPPSAVTFWGNPTSPISSGVAIPAGAAFVWVSGTLAPAIDPKLPPETRYGDTKTQAIGILKNIEGQLAKQGLTLRDVVYIRCYLLADPAKGNKLDVDGWNEAYTQFFGTPENPTKTARSTIGVAALVAPGFLIEAEAFAVYPTKAR
jgi:enamine deaminase RidA (YjgF/YER057c/UK114 family)